jgi:acyl dehydratase
MTETYTFADIPQLAGRKFVSPWLSVDQRRLELFDQSTFYDPEEYGWDVESFPNDMLEGFHLLGLLPYLVNRTMKLDDPSAFALNYGLDRVRFVTPVYVGEQLRACGVVAEVRPKNAGYLILKQTTVEVQGRERPGFTADVWSLVLPRVPEHVVR